MFPSSGAAHPPPHQLFAGRYLVDGQLPWGGPAPYYRVTSEGTPLVVCVLPMDVSRSARAETEFSRLAHALGQAKARALPKLLDAGIIDGVPYLALRETRGTLLSELLRDRTFSSTQVLRIATDVLHALEAAHGCGIVHRDLTPQNVVIHRTREGLLGAEVIGTGIAPLLRACPEASAHASHTGSGEHSVAYMAPELVGSEASPPAADLYAVGSMLHHMVVGTPPVVWDDNSAFDDIPGLPEVIARAMERRLNARYRDARAMLAALDWLEVESSKLNPRTQDIAPWMETSRIGSVRVPSIASSLPPLHASSNHPTGTVLTISSRPAGREAPRTLAPVVESTDAAPTARRRWLRALLLLALAGTLAASSAWWTRQNDATDESWAWERVLQ